MKTGFAWTGNMKNISASLFVTGLFGVHSFTSGISAISPVRKRKMAIVFAVGLSVIGMAGITDETHAQVCCDTSVYPSSGNNDDYYQNDSQHEWLDGNNIVADDDEYAVSTFETGNTELLYTQELIANFAADAFSCLDSEATLSDYVVRIRIRLANPGSTAFWVGLYDGEVDYAGTDYLAGYDTEDTYISDEWTDIEIPMADFYDDNTLTADILQGGGFKIEFGNFIYSSEFNVNPGTLYVDSISITSDDFVPSGYVCEEVSVPTITTSATTDITSTSATLNATLSNDGGETPTVALAWGTESGSYPNSCTPVTNVGDEYSCNISGLTAGVIYYVQASATNSGGTGTGSEASFRTAADGSDEEDDNDPDLRDVDGSDDDADIDDHECTPRKLSAKVSADGTVGLSWKKPCEAVDTIVIERKIGGGAFEKITTVKRNRHSYRDDVSDLSSGAYTYRIRGYRRASGKHTDYSDRKTVTVDHTDVSVDAASEVLIPPEPQIPVNPPVPPVSVDAAPAAAVSSNEPESTDPKGFFRSLVAALAPAGLVAGDFDASFPFPLLAMALTTVAYAGLAAGAVFAVSSTPVPLFSTSPAPLREAVSRIFSMIGFLGKKKREDGWGTVFDRETKRPLSGVAVSIINENGTVADVSVSDPRGHYGFLPDPGKYTLSIAKKAYDLETTERQDILYGELYVGQTIEIREHDAVRISIALKTSTVDWQDFARRKIDSYTSAFSVVKRDIFLILFYAGFAINAGIAYLFPTVLNLALFVLYLGMLVYSLFFRRRAYGMVTNAQTRQPVPFAMLSLYDISDSRERVSFSVSDVLGRYFMFVKNGEYHLQASGTFLGGARFEKTIRVRIKDGIVRSDIEV